MTVPFVAFASGILSGIHSITQKSGKSKASSSTRTTNSNIQFLLVGIATGVGLYALMDLQFKRHRIRERARAWLYSQQIDLLLSTEELDEKDGEEQVVNNSDDRVKNILESIETYGILLPTPSKYITPISLSNTEEFKNATMRVLASPSTSALTSSLHVGLITLPFGSKMEAREAKGAEIYYVLQGKGTLLRLLKGSEGDAQIEKSMKVNAGDTFLVNPWSIRSLANKGPEDFVFLRITDGGREYLNDLDYDAVIADDMNSAMRKVISSGIKNVKSIRTKLTDSLKNSSLKAMILDK